MIGLVVLLSANLVSWWVIGYENTLIFTAENFDSDGVFGSEYTVYVFENRTEQAESGDQYMDFRQSTRDRFIQTLQQSAGVRNVTVHPGSFLIDDSYPIEYSDHEGAYFFTVNRSFPMFVKVESITYAPEYVLAYESYGIWIFGWWRIKQHFVGGS